MKNKMQFQEWMNSDKPFIYLNDQNVLKILNYKKILQYTPKEISFLLNKKILNVKGEKLNIEYFDEDEICVHGYIVSITYQGG